VSRFTTTIVLPWGCHSVARAAPHHSRRLVPYRRSDSLPRPAASLRFGRAPRPGCARGNLRLHSAGQDTRYPRQPPGGTRAVVGFWPQGTL